MLRPTFRCFITCDCCVPRLVAHHFLRALGISCDIVCHVYGGKICDVICHVYGHMICDVTSHVNGEMTHSRADNSAEENRGLAHRLLESATQSA